MSTVNMLLTVVKLQPLTSNAASFQAGAPQGTAVGSIMGASPGSAISLASLSPAGALQIVGTSLQVGPTPPSAPGTVTFALIEALTGAINTPNQTSGFSISVLAGIPVNTAIPTISGTAKVGQTLTAAPGSWTNAPTSFAYQWNRAGAAITGAVSPAYVPVAADVGNALTVSVIATDAAGASASATSAPTAAVVADPPAGISFVADGGYGGARGSSMTLAVPAGIVQGDLMLAFTMFGASSPAGSIAAPSGWTPITSTAQYQGGSHTYKGFYFYKIAGAAEPASYTFTVAGSPTGPFLDGNIRAYAGTDTVTPIGGSAAISASAVASITVPAISETFAPGEWAVYCSASNTSSATFSAGSPNALSHAVFFNTGEVAASYAIGDFVPASAPAAETLAWSGTGGGIAAVCITIRPLGAPPVKSGLSVSNGVLLRNGVPYRGIGVDYVDVFDNVLSGQADYTTQFPLLAAAGIPFIRFRLGFWPNDISPFIGNPSALFAKLDPLVASATANGIGLIPSLFWNWQSICSVENENCQAWGNLNSKTIATATSFAGAVATHYAGNPNIWAFELANEMDVQIGYPQAYTQYPNGNGTLPYTAADNITFQQLLVGYQAVSTAIKTADPNRLVTSGFGIPQVYAYNYYTSGTQNADTEAQFQSIIQTINGHGDFISLHDYKSSFDQSFNMRFTDVSIDNNSIMQVMATLGKPLFIGEFGAAVGTDDSTQALCDTDFQNMVNTFVASSAPLACAWVYDYPPQDSILNMQLPGGNYPSGERTNLMSMITAANRALASSPTTGAHALAAQAINGPAGPLSIPAIGTQPSGSVMLAWVGRGRLADFTSSADPKDNLGATYGQVGSTHSYAPGFPNSGEALYSLAPAVGGPGYTASIPVTNLDEITFEVIEIKNARAIQDVQWNHVDGAPNTSLNVTTTGPATLVAIWTGDSSANTITAVPDSGFTVIDIQSLASNNIEAAFATKDVSAAGTYNVTWTATPTQGANMWLIAIQ